ncbi:MAG TPA: ATP-binding cassette domain-containing protein [Spirochaetia bacterium]|nr:ATP-binding cassette domain-containing protein [Spirochaetia bacterium]
MGSNISVQLENVSLFRGNAVILNQVSLLFRASRTTVIVGPSGSGKSTLLKIAAGIILPDEGKAMVNGVDFREMNEAQNLEFRKSNGFIFQDAALIANKSIYQNLSLPLNVHFRRMKEEEIKRRISQLLARIGFVDNLDSRPDDLSAGECKMISFVRALVTDPSIIFMDNPTLSVDSRAADSMVEIITELKRMGKTILLVTHEAPLIAKLADDLVVMDEGRIIESGEFASVVKTTNKEVRTILAKVLNEAATYDGDILDLLEPGGIEKIFE